MKLKMSKMYAYPKRPLFLVIINSKKIGFRLSMKAKAELVENGSGGNSIYSIKVDEEIIWVSNKEFKENNFIEFPIPWDIVQKYDSIGG